MKEPKLEQPLLFLSDVHLGGFSDEENARIESELIQLINYCQRNKIRMAVLGDLFDYWMEYPNHVPSLGEKLLNRFEDYNKELGPTLFVTGNHDNWTRDHLTQRGFYLHHEHYIFKIDHQKVMVLHGDGLADDRHNLRRPPMHRLLRNEQFLQIFQTLLSPSSGIKAMKYFSRINRWIWASGEERKLNQWARKQLKRTNTDIILCGHDHLPRRKQFPFGTYINLGTFYKHHSMAFYNNNELSLVYWEAGTQSLKQFETTN